MKAALYARVSTDNQKDEKTIETQLAEIKAAILTDGNILAPEHIFTDEGWSGAYLERPSLDKLRQCAKQREFEIVYTYDKGRVSRRYIYQEIVLDELRSLEIGFKSLHDVNGTSPEEQVMGGVMGIFHEYERVKTAERFRLAKLNKVRTGKLLGYTPPYGYTYIPVSGKGTQKTNGYFELNPDEAEVVKKIFTWVGVEHISLREVIRRLHKANILPRKNRRDSWTKGPVIRLLQNETYIGKHYYNKSESIVPKNPLKERKYFQHTDKTSRRIRDKSEWLMVEVPSIVTEELFNKAKEQIELNAKYASRNTKHEYLLGGLIYCVCGAKRSCDTARGHYYYRCTDRHRRFPEPTECIQKGGIKVEVLDSTTWDKIAILLTEPRLLSEQYERYKREQADISIDEARINSLHSQLDKLKEEEKRYIKAYGRGSLTESMFDESVIEVRKQKDTVETELRTLVNAKPKTIPDINTDKLAEKFTHLLDNLSFEDKKYVIRGLIDKIVATKEEATIWGNIPINRLETAGLYANDSSGNAPTQPEIGSKPLEIGLNVKYRNIKVPTQLPFELKLRMPKPDHGGRGYSDGYIATIEKTLYV